MLKHRKTRSIVGESFELLEDPVMKDNTYFKYVLLNFANILLARLKPKTNFYSQAFKIIILKYLNN